MIPVLSNQTVVPPFAQVSPVQFSKQEAHEEPEHEDDDPKELDEAIEKHFEKEEHPHQ